MEDLGVNQGDTPRINVERDEEVAYWAAEFCISRELLRDVVSRVGPRLRDVAAYLEFERKGLVLRRY
jgi:hypothetical protein